MYGTVAWPMSPQDIHSVAPPARGAAVGHLVGGRDAGACSTKTSRILWAGITASVLVGIALLVAAWLWPSSSAASRDASAAARGGPDVPPAPQPKADAEAEAEGASAQASASADAALAAAPAATPAELPRAVEGVTRLTSVAQVRQVLRQAGGPYVLMLGAPWCGACKATLPHFRAAAKANAALPVGYYLHMAAELPGDFIRELDIDKTGVPQLRVSDGRQPGAQLYKGPAASAAELTDLGRRLAEEYAP